MDESDARQVAARIHRDGPVVDMVSPLLARRPEVAEEYAKAGVHVVGASLPTGHVVDDDQDSLIGGLAGWTRLRRNIEESPLLTMITRADQLRGVTEEGSVGIIIQSQNAAHFEGDIDNVDIFYELGQRAAGLAYNVRNLLVDGAFEPSNAGLSLLGRRVVREMNRVGMIIDGAHTGERSTLEAMAMTESPFIFSHSGVKALHDHPRNITDDQVRECARTAGVIGIFGVPYFLTGRSSIQLPSMIEHVRYVADLVGVRHVGIGVDYLPDASPYLSEQEQQEAEAAATSGRRWRWEAADLPHPPWLIAEEIDRPEKLPELTVGLLMAGFSAEETAMIMGKNFARVFQEVWRPPLSAGLHAGRGAP